MSQAEVEVEVVNHDELVRKNIQSMNLPGIKGPRDLVGAAFQFGIKGQKGVIIGAVTGVDFVANNYCNIYVANVMYGGRHVSHISFCDKVWKLHINGHQTGSQSWNGAFTLLPELI